MRLEFLTREGCSGSADLRDQLDQAIVDLGQAITVDVVDVSGLEGADYRTGYGTPTILWEGEDLLGAERPAPAAPT